MSINPCANSVNCPNGNCVGCKNGNIDCNDPRCWPNCSNCNTSTSTTSSNWWIIMIILILAGILLVLMFIVGYDYWNKSKEAAEPKSLTLNKHVHTTPISVVPPPSVAMTTVTSPPVASSVVSPQTSYVNPVNYEGVELSYENC